MSLSRAGDLVITQVFADSIDFFFRSQVVAMNRVDVRLAQFFFLMSFLGA